MEKEEEEKDKKKDKGDKKDKSGKHLPRRGKWPINCWSKSPRNSGSTLILV